MTLLPPHIRASPLTSSTELAELRGDYSFRSRLPLDSLGRKTTEEYKYVVEIKVRGNLENIRYLIPNNGLIHYDSPV